MQSNEETFAKYVVGANLFLLGYTNPKKNIQVLDAFWWGQSPHQKNDFVQILEQKKIPFQFFQKCSNFYERSKIG